MVEILRITYYLYEFKRTKQGEVPIYCKLTTDGINRQQFSTRLYIRPEIWDKDAQCVRGTSEDAVLINRRLQDITVELKSIERKLYEADGNVSLDEIYSLYKNKTANEHTLCGIFRERIKRMESLVGKEYSPSTLQKFREVFAHVERYIQNLYKSTDIPIRRVDYFFVKQFEDTLLSQGLKAITINKIMQRLRQMVVYAFKCNYIQQDPFVEYRPLKERKRLVFLTQEELKLLEDYHFAQKLIIWFERFCKVNEYVQPRISNQKVNSYLREIAEVVGIDKKLTHHTARKTFATTILLYNDVPIEVVSKLLGHSDISVTQRSYAQVLNKNISNHIGRLEKVLDM